VASRLCHHYSFRSMLGLQSCQWMPPRRTGRKHVAYPLGRDIVCREKLIEKG